MLPIKLLTPFQAENDHHIKDTYNYVTVQVRGACAAVAVRGDLRPGSCPDSLGCTPH